MKKIFTFTIIAMLAVFLVGLFIKGITENDDSIRPTLTKVYKTSYGCIESTSLNGHLYVATSSGGIMHDLSCSCLTNAERNLSLDN